MGAVLQYRQKAEMSPVFTRRWPDFWWAFLPVHRGCSQLILNHTYRAILRTIVFLKKGKIKVDCVTIVIFIGIY